MLGIIFFELRNHTCPHEKTSILNMYGYSNVHIKKFAVSFGVLNSYMHIINKQYSSIKQHSSICFNPT